MSLAPNSSTFVFLLYGIAISCWGIYSAKKLDIKYRMQSLPKIQQRNKFCLQCGKPLMPETKFCGSCGAPVKEVIQKEPGAETKTAVHVPKFCLQCGKPIKAGNKFCGACGAPIRKR